MRKAVILGSALLLVAAAGCHKDTNKTGSGSTSGQSTAGTGSSSTGSTGSSGTTATTGTSSSTGSTGTTSSTGSTSGSGGTTGTSLDAGLLAYCSGSGAPINVGDTTQDGGSSATCAGNLAQRTFRFALCTCDALTVNQHLNTSSFAYLDAGFPDGGNGLVLVTGRNNASIGVNAGISTSANNAQLNVGGSLFDSDGGITALGPVSVAGELHVGSASQSTASSSVALDAFAASDLLGNWNLGGDLFQPAGALDTGVTFSGSHQKIATNVTVDDPCDCTNLVDIAGIVGSHAANNDNANIGLVDPDAGFGDAGLDPALYASGTGPTTLDIPCGRYYFAGPGDGGPAVDIESGTTWNITGRTALLVDGDFVINGGMNINVPPGSELDLFISGSLSIAQPSTLGEQDNVAGTRIYVGGSQPIALTTPVNIYANIYAPFALFETDHPTTINGALFVKALVNNVGGAQGGNINIVYDESVLSAGTECVTPPVDAGFEVVDAGFYDDGGAIDGGVVAVDAGPVVTGCQTCNDCNNQACNVPTDGGPGVCGGCVTSADCCAPLTCQSGTCQVVFK